MAVVYVSCPPPLKMKKTDTSSRYTRSNSEKQASESGFFLATPSQTTSRIRSAGLTLPLGGRLWPTSPAHTVTSRLTLATRASSSTLICAARWAPNGRTTRICMIVRQHVRSLSLAIRRISRRLIGSFGVFGSIRRGDGVLYLISIDWLYFHGSDQFSCLLDDLRDCLAVYMDLRGRIGACCSSWLMSDAIDTIPVIDLFSASFWRESTA